MKYIIQTSVGKWGIEVTAKKGDDTYITKFYPNEFLLTDEMIDEIRSAAGNDENILAKVSD